ncbi:hypothetical protein L195_g037287, partial [Trifolium pratense]
GVPPFDSRNCDEEGAKTTFTFKEGNTFPADSGSQLKPSWDLRFTEEEEEEEEEEVIGFAREVHRRICDEFSEE